MLHATTPSHTPLFPPEDRAFVEAVGRIATANPFLPERLDAERAALGPAYVESGPVWCAGDGLAARSECLHRLRARLGPVLERARARLAAGGAMNAAERAIYQEACLYFLYDTFAERLQGLIETSATRVELYDEFAREHARLFALPAVGPGPSRAHMLAYFFQLRRAFHYLFWSVLGGSRAAALLRAAAWRSIFSCDLRRYWRSLYRHADESSTLVTGPTGSGKDLVARAIGLSRYVPFDEATQCFVADHHQSYHPINLSALSPTLIESELFGHERGAFTGAVADRTGRLERCKPGGTVFLDEIGELAPELQVKLLRVLQNRCFERVGSAEERPFTGKIVAATHRDLAERMRVGKFREDLYYRICSDRITTPSLRAQLDEAPGERRHLVRFISARVAGADDVDDLADAVDGWIEQHLPAGYAWPGNVRELEQCVRSVIWQGSYEPASRAGGPNGPSGDDGGDLGRPFVEGTLSSEEAIVRYVTIVQAQTGSYRETARRLEMDRRTVERKIDRTLLRRLTGRGEG